MERITGRRNAHSDRAEGVMGGVSEWRGWGERGKKEKGIRP